MTSPLELCDSDAGPSGHAAQTQGPVSTTRVVLHALWVGVAAAYVQLAVLGVIASASDHDPDLGRGIGAGLLFSLLLAPLWLPAALVLSGVAGLAAAAAARRAARAGAGRRAIASWAAGAAAATAGTGGLLLLIGLGLGPLGATAFVAAAVAGGTAVLLARGAPRPTPGTGRAPWGLAALLTGVVALTLGSWAWFRTAWVWDPDEECAARLAGSDAVYATVAFPPQAWCVSPHDAVAFLPAWTGPALVLLIAATVACGLVAMLGWRGLRAGVGAGAVVAVGVVVAALAGVPQPPAQAHEQARAAAAAASAAAERESAAELTRRPAAPRPTAEAPAPRPPVSATRARADLAALTAAAERAGGADLLWEAPLGVTATPCASRAGGKTDGTRLELTGQFTTVDLATAVDDADFLQITQANERAAKAIVEAWAARLLGAPDALHGEWWQGPRAAASVETAHVGFDGGVGQIRVETVCAMIG